MDTAQENVGEMNCTGKIPKVKLNSIQRGMSQVNSGEAYLMEGGLNTREGRPGVRDVCRSFLLCSWRCGDGRMRNRRLSKEGRQRSQKSLELKESRFTEKLEI